MDGRVCERTGVKFLFLILTVSGGFRQALSETQSLKNVTRSEGKNATIECRSASMNSTNQPSWFKYDPQKVVIYDASSSSNIDSSKYLVGNGNNNLTVMNAELSDAATYCCNVGDSIDYCSNVVVIGPLTATVNPSNLVQVGDTVNLICSLTYNSPTKDPSAPFPLSDEQDPKLVVYVGDDEILGEQVVDVATVPHTKTFSFSKTVLVADLDRTLYCEVTSTEPSSYTLAYANVAEIAVTIIYPNNVESVTREYKVNDTFQCIADRFPFLEVTWTDFSTSPIISNGTGSATAKVLTAGFYSWKCSTTSPLEENRASKLIFFTALNPPDLQTTTKPVRVTVNAGRSVGVKISLPILLTAGCMLLIACIVF